MSTTLIVVASASPAAILGALALWLPAKWARDDAADYRSEAERTFDAATSLADEVERTRNLPWYWPTDPDVTGEVLAVEPGRTYVVGEDGPVLLALSDRPAADEDEVGDEQPGEAASSIPSRLKAWATDVLDRVHDWLPNLVQQWRERNDVGSGEQATAEDPFEQFRIDDSPRGLSNVVAGNWITAEPTPEPEPVRIVRRDRYRPAGETGQFPYVKVAGAPRHAAPEPEMPAINQTIPAQRTDGEL